MLSFIEPDEWRTRVASIEQQLEALVSPRAVRGQPLPDLRYSIADDRAGWYLYLVDTALHNVFKYEPAQGSRVLPVFARLGTDFDLVLSIGNVEDRVKRMLGNERGQPDSILFELLVATLWRRDGWAVEVLPDNPGGKSPDIRAHRDGQEWFIECKRLRKSSDYSEAERDKWLLMWTQLRDLLFDCRYSAVFDVEFHVELQSLPDDFLVRELAGKLRLIQLPCVIADNATWTVSAKPVDYPTIHEHLAQYLVKYPSDQVNELIGGHRDPNRGFTCALVGKFERMGGGQGNDQFLDDLAFAVGAFWSCDAPASIGKKARDIRTHVARALEQLPESGNTAIHVALETLDGPPVELRRHLRIVRSVQTMDFRGRPLPWLFCHLLQSYAPPNQEWVIDETVHYFGPGKPDDRPLDNFWVIAPPDDPNVTGVHWMRDPP